MASGAAGAHNVQLHTHRDNSETILKIKRSNLNLEKNLGASETYDIHTRRDNAHKKLSEVES